MRQSLQISTCMVMTLALAACGGGGGESSSAPATGERTFPSQVNIRGTNYTALMSSGMRLYGQNGLFELACVSVGKDCDMGATEISYENGTASQSVSADGGITLTLKSPGGVNTTTMKLDSQWGMLQDPRGCTYSRPLQLPADIPLTVGNTYSTSGVTVTRTCPDGSSSTDTWYGRKFFIQTDTGETTQWTYDAFDAAKVHSYQVSFSITWDTVQNTIGRMMLIDIYDYKKNKGVLFNSAP